MMKPFGALCANNGSTALGNGAITGVLLITESACAALYEKRPWVEDESKNESATPRPACFSFAMCANAGSMALSNFTITGA